MSSRMVKDTAVSRTLDIACISHVVDLEPHQYVCMYVYIHVHTGCIPGTRR